MMNSAGLIAATLTLCLAAALLLMDARPARDGAVMELQTGPVTIAAGAPGAPVRLVAETCAPGCPALALRIGRGSASAQRAEGEAGRVQRLGAGTLERSGLAEEGGDHILGQQRRMGEAARPEGR